MFPISTEKEIEEEVGEVRHVESDCRDCPECKGCGRKYKRYVYYTCDKCGEEMHEEDMNYTLDGRQLCEKCYRKAE